ncbi:MAG: hypothetical protein AAGU77_07500, partial [Bacillota bacterium]
MKQPEREFPFRLLFCLFSDIERDGRAEKPPNVSQIIEQPAGAARLRDISLRAAFASCMKYSWLLKRSS